MNKQVSSFPGAQLALEGKAPAVGPLMLETGKQLREGESLAQSYTASYTARARAAPQEC